MNKVYNDSTISLDKSNQEVFVTYFFYAKFITSTFTHTNNNDNMYRL